MDLISASSPRTGAFAAAPRMGLTEHLCAEVARGPWTLQARPLTGLTASRLIVVPLKQSWAGAAALLGRGVLGASCWGHVGGVHTQVKRTRDLRASGLKLRNRRVNQRIPMTLSSRLILGSHQTPAGVAPKSCASPLGLESAP